MGKYLDLIRSAEPRGSEAQRPHRATPDWLTAWRALATLTAGLTAQDPRLPLIMAELDRCDDAYLSGDWTAFHQAADRVRCAMLNGGRR
ncbi:MAG TPA: hypothetical protein VJT11_01815 [Nitrospiraceae bacterium]|nr:hypothetical protein [Nitrospiraceae bacterium]